MSSSRKLCHYLHLPLQSGDAGTLQRMGRRYTPAAYAATVRHAVRLLPHLGLGTDVMTGFPGETDEAFAHTRDLVAALPFSNLHVFAYSERPGTRAAGLAEPVPPAVRKTRARELLRLHDEKRQAFARRCVGRTVEVLVESVGKDGCGRGWSGEYLDCRVAGIGREQIGRIVTFTPGSVQAGAILA